MTDVGDWRIATLTVDPADDTTAATLVVVSPDGTETLLTTTPGDDPATWTSEPYELTTPGEWVERWTVTGTGAGAQRAIVRVAPDPAAALSGQRVYASTGDYATWLGTAPPPGARRALAAASRVVDELLLTAVYATDAAGMPTDPVVAEALTRATCAQAAYQAALGDPAGVGAGHISQASIGSISFTRAAPGSQGSTPGRYSPQAVQILRQAGLLGHGPYGW